MMRFVREEKTRYKCVKFILINKDIKHKINIKTDFQMEANTLLYKILY